MIIKTVKNILDANDRIARDNRSLFDANGVFVINLMSSPGAGKTTLVERTIEALRARYRIAVIEGDIQDTCDAERIARLDIPVTQINTGGACHIDGNMVREALPNFDLSGIDLLITENVGNLVCPAEFNVGENCKVMILSTPEGADKPMKYPLMFHESSALIINKMDLLDYVDFDLDKARRDALAINPKLAIFTVSCKTGEGLAPWIQWLTGQVEAFRKSRP
ncbi:MAG TPA: hydrogenase nickel incorporation protein HypB [Syntrophales bacterium]|jgi:hydrogenase nickel incorporation protein HypB|nr:hydrogenase nickel incorporation protein HypB [Syntrophales bacterium]HPX56452.1 hydrogenase nickel incorporation protein HypB [Syntrophales bacterium]HQA83250.1 hydrogenase nickel incorporation protein HypB [Syntrophales bacterium]